MNMLSQMEGLESLGEAGRTFLSTLSGTTTARTVAPAAQNRSRHLLCPHGQGEPPGGATTATGHKEKYPLYKPVFAAEERRASMRQLGTWTCVRLRSRTEGLGAL